MAIAADVPRSEPSNRVQLDSEQTVVKWIHGYCDRLLLLTLIQRQ